MGIKFFRILLLLLSFFFLAASSIYTSSIIGQSKTVQTIETDPVALITNTLVDLEGNYIIAGQTVDNNLYLVKYNSDGKIIWEQYLGGNNSDVIETIALDSYNNLLVVGETESDDFPITENAAQRMFGGATDIFVSKINSQGQTLWTTYIGGSGKEEFQPYTDGITISNENDIAIWGSTWSSDFPISSNAIQKLFAGGDTSDFPVNSGGGSDGFVVQFDANGDVDWSTYLGGDGHEYFNTIQFDSENNLQVIGSSSSSDYPTLNAMQDEYAGLRDLVITKFSASGDLLWSTYFGGPYGYETIIETISDNENQIYLSAWTLGGFPMTPDAFQAEKGGSRDNLFAKISSNGDLIWSTYLGGFSNEGYETRLLWENGYDLKNYQDNMGEMKLDSNGDLIFVGISESVNYPMKNEFQNNKFGPYDIVISKLGKDGNLIFSSYLGGNSTEDQVDLLIDSNNNIIITGNVWSRDFQLYDAVQLVNGGQHDIFVTKITSQGELVWSTYFGGKDEEYLYESILDGSDNIILLGTTKSENFFVTDNSVFNNLTDGFITKFNTMGKVSWSGYLAGDGVEDFNRFSFLLDKNGNYLVTGTSTSTNFIGQNEEYKLGFVSKIDSNGKVDWSQKIGLSIESAEDFPTMLYIILVSTISAGFIVFYSYYSKSKQLESYLLNSNIEGILRTMFNSKSKIIHVFIANNTIEDKGLEKEIKNVIPKEISDFKLLLHPVRLSIMKLLYENPIIISAELRSELGISWSEFNSHLKKLTKTGHLKAEINFIDGSIKNVISMEPLGLKEFERLQRVLLEFIDTTPHIDRYIDQIDRKNKRSINDDLYPPDES